MYAVIKTGGKQHKVKAGDVIEVEKIVHDGETMTFQPILVVDDDGKTHVGAEAAKAVVTAKPLGGEEGREGQDLQVPAEERLREAAGHRQMLTMLEIEDVKFGAAPKRATKAKAEPAADVEDRGGRPRAVEAADVGRITTGSLEALWHTRRAAARPGTAAIPMRSASA